MDIRKCASNRLWLLAPELVQKRDGALHVRSPMPSSVQSVVQHPHLIVMQPLRRFLHPPDMQNLASVRCGRGGW